MRRPKLRNSETARKNLKSRACSALLLRSRRAGTASQNTLRASESSCQAEGGFGCPCLTWGRRDASSGGCLSFSSQACAWVVASLSKQARTVTGSFAANSKQSLLM